jgi:hypothetical protein
MMDYTKIPQRQIIKNSVKDAETLLKTVLELERENSRVPYTKIEYNEDKSVKI